MKKFEELRARHPVFFYNQCGFERSGSDLIFSFEFELEPGIFFRPKLVIKNAPRMDFLSEAVLRNIVFQIGLTEIPSYWKAACSPRIIVRAGGLSDYEIGWFKKLLLKGMSEFFFVNGVSFTELDFVSFTAEGKSSALSLHESLSDGGILIPVGGGKDSIVTMELLKRSGKELGCFALNPTPAVLEAVRVSGIKRLVAAERVIDRNLLLLNERGYLNGHTPFSSCIAFLSAACAVIFGYKSVAVSNERSANEGNVSFRGMEVNHQYSKSVEFERDFRDYLSKRIAPHIDYFSFLRPVYELQIAKIFSGLTDYFPIFRSCNKGQKRGVWCEECPKCLFVFSILFPFIEERRLIGEIFSENLFDKKELLPVAFSLLGRGERKLFECVGSLEENKIAFYLCVKKAEERTGRLPLILAVAAEKILALEKNLEERARLIIHSWDDNNFVPDYISGFLRDEVKKL